MNGGASRVHLLELDVRDDPEALRRIVSICRRRNCRIVELTYAATAQGAGRLTLGIAGTPDQSRQLTRWLANLVDVLAIRCGDPP